MGGQASRAADVEVDESGEDFCQSLSISAERYYRGIIGARSLFDKREVHLRMMIFNLRLSVTSEPHGMYYDEEYCFHDEEAAWSAFATWNGEEAPEGWAKNPSTGELGPGFIGAEVPTPVADKLLGLLQVKKSTRRRKTP